MHNTQSHIASRTIQESLEWIHIIINHSSSAPPPVVEQERRSYTPETDSELVAHNATPTRPDYSGSLKQEVARPSMIWTDCVDKEGQTCLIERTGVRLVPTTHQGMGTTKRRP